MHWRTLSGFLPSSRPRQCRISHHSSCRPRRSLASRNSPSPPNLSSRTQARLHNLRNRLPRFLRTYTTPLFNAPVAHITSFLILHEITAVVPLIGLAGAFHYAAWIPTFRTSDGSGLVDQGVERFGKWLRKRGWVDGKTQDGATSAAPYAEGVAQTGTRGLSADNGAQ